MNAKATRVVVSKHCATSSNHHSAGIVEMYMIQISDCYRAVLNDIVAAGNVSAVAMALMVNTRDRAGSQAAANEPAGVGRENPKVVNIIVDDHGGVEDKSYPKDETGHLTSRVYPDKMPLSPLLMFPSLFRYIG